jgi:acylphosphatase
MADIHKKAILKGRVQGVGFRFSAREQARRLGIKGYVKNLPNGDVEILASGSEKNVEKYLQWAHEGPAYAHVDDIQIEDAEPTSYHTFDVKH